MKAIILFLLCLLTYTSSQAQRRIKYAVGTERCLDASGQPIPDCVIISKPNGEFTPMLLDSMFFNLQEFSESAVDSIYQFNDTLFVVFFDAPTLKYKAAGLNGIYSASNNNATMKVNNIKLPTTGSGIVDFQTAAGLGHVQINGAFNTPLQAYGQLSEGYGLYISQNASARSQIGFTTTGSIGTNVNKTWQLGGANGNFGIADRTYSNAQIFKIDQHASAISLKANQLELFADSLGTVGMSGYNSSRTLSTSPTNFAGWDANGKLQKYDITDAGSSGFNYDTLAEQSTNDTFLGEDIFFRMYYDEGGSDHFKFLTGLSNSVIDWMVKAEVTSINANNNSLDQNNSVSLEVDMSGDYKIHLLDSQELVFIKVWYTKQ